MAVREASLKYEFRQYTVYANRIGAGIPEKEIRKEYTRLRDILRKRIETINKSEFAGQGIAGQFPDGLPKLSEISPADLPYVLQQFATAIRSNSGSLKGLRKRRKDTLESLHESGYTNINEENIASFARFVEEARERGLAKVYGSDNIATMFDETVALGIDPDDVLKDFDWWKENIDAAEDAAAKLRGRGEDVTAEKIRKELENIGKELEL